MLSRLRAQDAAPAANSGPTAPSEASEASDYDEYDVPEDRIGAVAKRAMDRASAAAAAETRATARAPPRRPPRMDAGMLLGPRGFRALREMARGSAFPGVSATKAEKLRAFDGAMRMYREWTLQMFPSYRFRDTLAKIERQCRTGQMKAYMSSLERAVRDDLPFDEVAYMADAAIDDASAAVSGSSNGAPVAPPPAAPMRSALLFKSTAPPSAPPAVDSAASTVRPAPAPNAAFEAEIAAAMDAVPFDDDDFDPLGPSPSISATLN